ncbi:PTS sugar transporter subunit IIA domain-containing protein [Enterococcus faecium]|uniref:PTS sugar transporter subunit IIA domain-containing protein n=1 Tax=Enterococcus faecium TaxID=1352 RepID=UPI0037C1B3D3
MTISQYHDIVIRPIRAEEQILVFTDLLGGSVNQTFAKFLDRYNIQLIAGVNLPIFNDFSLSNR